MEPTTATYSSVHMRERDKILEERHRKELEIIERKVDRLKWSNNDTLKQLFEMQTRANRVAQSLGFIDIYEAQVLIDAEDHELPYKECLGRIGQLQTELRLENMRGDNLQDQLKLVKEERDKLKTANEVADQAHKTAVLKYESEASALSHQIQGLQSRYDALAEIKERAAARYKSDFKKWRVVKNWLFTNEDDPKETKEENISEEEKKKRETARIKSKRKFLMELGLDSSFFGEDGDLEDDKENQGLPSQESKKRQSKGSPLSVKRKASTVTTSINTTPTLQNAKPIPVSSSPNIFFDPPTTTAQTALTLRPITNTTINSSPIIRSISKPFERSVGNSSDTEEDSQAVGLFPAAIMTPFSPSTLKSRLPVTMNPSKTEDKSHSQTHGPSGTPSSSFPRLNTITKVTVPPLSLKPMVIQSNTRRRNDISVISRDAETMQPLKMRRLSGNGLHEGHMDSNTSGLATPPVSEKHLRAASSRNRKGKEAIVSTPTNPPGQKRIEDYSAFKGRGRYAKDMGLEEKSINAQYTIDPTLNAGLDFQYDEVVRGKQDRKRMEAGDCESCRDYYEAIGPLPARLQPPLWRSPQKNRAKPCPMHHKNHASGSKGDTESRQSEINSHKQVISRHRHHWARASTPPGYWNIGFPDTQETEEINDRAREMHKKKLLDVEDAVKRGDGRYKKR